MESWQVLLRVRGWDSEYPSVQNFLRHYDRQVRSERTRRNTLFALGQFCRFAGKSPEELVALDPKVASGLLQGFLDLKRREEKSIRYINVLSAYLEVFFRVNGFKNGRGLVVERYYQPARYRKRPEYVPTADEICRMAYAAGSKRNSAMILLAYASGLRNATIRALLYRDVREELEKGLEVVKTPVYPEMKRVDLGACKGGIPYYTFILGEAVKALSEYLAERGRIGDEDPLFSSETTNIPAEVRRRLKVKWDTLGAVVKRAAERAGIKEWRHVTPHCLRKAFESALRNSGMDVDDREFLMGHMLPSSKDTYHDRSKVEGLRAKYAKVRFFRSGEPDKVEMIKSFAKSLGIEELEVKIAKLRKYEGALTEEEAIGRILREEFIGPMRVETSKRRGGDPDPQLIIKEENLEAYLREGWQFASVLPSQKILIRK